MKRQTNILILFVFFFNISAFAKSTDEDAPLHIEADELEMHENEGTSIYKGNVKINKGSIKITGDKIVISNKNGRLHRVQVNGKPATFYQLNDLDEAINAESYIMDYKAKTGILELKEKAILLKNKNHFSSEHIIYNTLKDIVKAGNHNAPSAQQKPRVKITIYPETSKKQTPEKN
jgi:lipopolysaccharide export system protein LptA